MVGMFFNGSDKDRVVQSQGMGTLQRKLSFNLQNINFCPSLKLAAKKFQKYRNLETLI